MGEPYLLQTGFFPGTRGSLHVTAFLPVDQPTICRVIHVPAFAEEMNKSRAMVAAQARVLAARGAMVLVPDLFGTGDSEGDFEQARWDTWREDLLALVRGLAAAASTPLVLWGHRLGCILAAEVATAMPDPPAQLILWQPVHSGRQQLTQFLRLRMVASLSRQTTGVDTVAGLREQLGAGETIDVAGYRLSGGLYSQLEQMQLGVIPLSSTTPVHILEVTGTTDSPATPVTQRQVEQWRQLGLECHTTVVVGDPFWTTQELGTSVGLIEQTTEAIMGPSSAADARTVEKTGDGRHLFRLDGLEMATENGLQSVTFECSGSQLAGILHNPTRQGATTAVLIIVGGPQYRIGSHRQFVQLAQALAAAGIPVLRFDYRGMGDSDGDFRGFTGVGEDIRSAIDALLQSAPTVRNTVLWGLCDAATAAMFYAPEDSRVSGLVLANPWVYSEQGAARAYLRHYYMRRIVSRAFWSKVFTGAFKPGKSLQSVLEFGRQALSPRRAPPDVPTDSPPPNTIAGDLVAGFASSLARFPGPVLLVLSGSDLTAAEFSDASQADAGLRRELGNPLVRHLRLPGADHTFSGAAARQQMEEATVAFVAGMSGQPLMVEKS